ncbi:hypothetical protein QBC45DRAFT_413217 [Copromyces sp. CBS 386.78]|nr:hypothetical protein QBC45DRAFT_413217 [Copromyces sp. CBS 386.78]
MIASGLCRVAATTRAGRPTSWAMSKSAVLVHHPLGQHLVHHRQFLRPTTAASASQLAVAEQPDRLALEALPCSPAQIPEDNKDIGRAVPPAAAKQSVKRMIKRGKYWLNTQKDTLEVLKGLTDTNKTQQESQMTVERLSKIYDEISGFYYGVEQCPSKYRALAACRTAVDIAGSAVKAHEALWEAKFDLKEAQAELDRARAQGADAQDEALKVERVGKCEAARMARQKEFREANETALESAGIFLKTPHPQHCKPDDLKSENYEWMLRALDEILKYRDGRVVEWKQQLRDARIAQRKLNRSCEPSTGTPAMPIKQSGDQRIEQPAEAEDEAEQLNHVENTREQPSPSEEYQDEAEQFNHVENIREQHTPIEEFEDEAEQFNDVENIIIQECKDELERVKDVEQSKVHQRPGIKLSGTSTDLESVQLKEALAAHYPQILFPHKVNTALVETVRKLLEECCYRFALAHIPHHLAEKNWDSPEVVELKTWQRTFTNLLLKDSRTISAFNTTSVPARQRDSYVREHLETLNFVRNLAAHPRPLSPGPLARSLFRPVRKLARLFSDHYLQQDMQKLSSQTIRVLAALRTRRVENLAVGRTHELYRQIVADKAAVQRIRNQAPASQEHQAACATFENEIQRLVDALPVAIQADEEAMLEAELPPLIEMAEEMAAQVERRNAQMQLRLKATRKLSSDKVLDEMQLLVDKHARRMRNGTFPFSQLSERESELGFVGSPLPSAELGGVQEKLEPQEHERHQEDPEPHKQHNKTVDLKKPFNPNNLSIARRAMIRNALARDLQKEERKHEREQAKADADAEATSTPTEEEPSRPEFVPSLPEEEMMNEEAMDKSESDDMGPDRYHATTSGFFEMLERRENLPLEDFKARAKKEMAAAAEAGQARVKEAQVEAGASRCTAPIIDTTLTASLKYQVPSTKQLMARGLSRRAWSDKQSRALRVKYEKQQWLLTRKIDGLRKASLALMAEKGRLEVERQQARKGEEVQRRTQLGKTEEWGEEDKDKNKNKTELEPTTTTDAVDNQVDNEAAAATTATNDGLTGTLTKRLMKLASQQEKLEKTIEQVTERKRALEKSHKERQIELLGFLENERNPLFELDATEKKKEVTDGRRYLAKTTPEAAAAAAAAATLDGGGVVAAAGGGRKISYVDFIHSMELTAAEVRRTSIKARKGRYDYRVKTEAVQEVVSEVTLAPEAASAIEVITAAAEVAVAESSDHAPETAIAESSDSQTVALQEASSTEETGLSSTLVNHTAVPSGALESIPVQDAHAEEVKEEVIEGEKSEGGEGIMS